MKNLLLTFLFSIFAVAQTWAQRFIVDGIKYSRTSTSSSVNKTAGVEQFYYDDSLTYTGSVVIPSTVTYEGVTYRVNRINSAAFEGCVGLTSVTIPKTVTRIDGSAFSGCVGLTSITIPDSVTTIEQRTFYGCSNLKSIVIPEGVTSIGSSAFEYCSGLTSITIPVSVTSIAERTFADCYFDNSKFVNKSSCTSENIWGAKLCDKEQADGLLVKGSDAVFCRRWATSVIIPESVTVIGNYAFEGCTNLTAITIPKSVSEISMAAFKGCTNLTAITIPESVTEIGYSAFCKCM